jgi:hypothetical protein
MINPPFFFFFFFFIKKKNFFFFFFFVRDFDIAYHIMVCLFLFFIDVSGLNLFLFHSFSPHLAHGILLIGSFVSLFGYCLLVIGLASLGAS